MTPTDALADADAPRAPTLGLDALAFALAALAALSAKAGLLPLLPW